MKLKKLLRKNENTFEELSFEEVAQRYHLMLCSYGKKYSRYEFDEIYQIGLIALWEAYQMYDNLEISFGYFAKQRVFFKISKYHWSMTHDIKNETSKVKNVISLFQEAKDTNQATYFEVIEDPFDFTRIIEDKEAAKIIKKIISGFSEKKKKIWKLYLKGNNGTEIAKVIKMSRQGVSMSMTRDKEIIRKKLENLGILKGA
jgi:RNA polymerase sigma factor (sigma-70 family)